MRKFICLPTLAKSLLQVKIVLMLTYHYVLTNPNFFATLLENGYTYIYSLQNPRSTRINKTSFYCGHGGSSPRGRNRSQNFVASIHENFISGRKVKKCTQMRVWTRRIEPLRTKSFSKDGTYLQNLNFRQIFERG